MHYDTRGSGWRKENADAIYSYMDIVAKEAEDYALAHTSPLSPLLEEVEAFTLTETSYPACSPVGSKAGSSSW